jgi:GntR family transcriptional regulator
MLLSLDPKSPEPIFEQLAFQVKGAVARGEMQSGAQLPSVRELAKELAINPNTVARAYDSLEAQGVIVRRQGSGCFIADRAQTLSAVERERRLDAEVERVVTEAFHLGFGAEELRASVDRHLKRLRFKKSDASKRRANPERGS